MVDDVEAFVSDMHRIGASCSPREHMEWGVLTEIALPSGALLSVYEPLHARPKALKLGKKAKKVEKRAAKKAAKEKKSEQKQKKRLAKAAAKENKAEKKSAKKPAKPMKPAKPAKPKAREK